MDVATKWLKVGPHTRSGQTLPTIRGLVVHWLGNAGVGVTEHIDYFNGFRLSGPRYASYHYIIDTDGTIVHLIPNAECAWHAGPSSKTLPKTQALLGGLPNWRTLGISFAHPDWSGKPTPETQESLVEILRALSVRYSIPSSHILRHHDCTGKKCPWYYVDYPDKWSKLVDKIGGRDG